MRNLQYYGRRSLFTFLIFSIYLEDLFKMQRESSLPPTSLPKKQYWQLSRNRSQHIMPAGLLWCKLWSHFPVIRGGEILYKEISSFVHTDVNPSAEKWTHQWMSISFLFWPHTYLLLRCNRRVLTQGVVLSSIAGIGMHFHLSSALPPWFEIRHWDSLWIVGLWAQQSD